jgi:hypothetical protein
LNLVELALAGGIETNHQELSLQLRLADSREDFPQHIRGKIPCLS